MFFTGVDRMRKKLNKTRVVWRFLFLPRVINREWRWLEFAKIEQELIFSNGWVFIDKAWK
jgi:hypothetical protein